MGEEPLDYPENLFARRSQTGLDAAHVSRQGGVVECGIIRPAPQPGDQGAPVEFEAAGCGGTTGLPKAKATNPFDNKGIFTPPRQEVCHL